jgi:hypothetical protein
MRGAILGLAIVGAVLTTTPAGLSARRAQGPPTVLAPKPADSRPWPSAEELASRKREADRLPLFSGDEPLPFTLSADFRAVDRDRDPNSTKTFPATIEFARGDGTVVSMSLQIRTRGHSRRNNATCSFAPLRLEFDKTLTRGLAFEGHGAIKLGTHCRDGTEEVILREYAVYRMFNLLTPRSFRARLARATYVDNVRKQTIAVEYGLFIEDEDDVARRLEGRTTTLEKVIFARVDPDALNLMTLFEYMIGNTDMSIYSQHNVRLVQTPAGRRYPVPYDFDYSGLVDAAYAVPGKDLGIQSVRDRLFRGPCRTAAEWAPYVQKLQAAKPEFLAIYDAVPLSTSYRRQAKSYLEEFYRTIASPARFKQAVIDTCQRIGM